jgi:beta-xylosidase
MVSFDGEPKDVTPANYFEGPFMVRRGKRYFLMYSHGKTTEETYQVHYAVGESPLGPFTEGANSPILTTDKAAQILSPGHHAVFEKDGRSYILYHRHSIPFEPKAIDRQVCVDPLVFTSDGQIEKVKPSHEGVPIAQGRAVGRTNLADGSKATASASSEANDHTRADFVLDDNYATRWAAAKDAHGGWLQLDLGAVKAFHRQELRFEYAWKPYRFSVEQSVDGSVWSPLADTNKKPARGSPVVIDRPGNARYLRLVFPESAQGADLSLFEWAVY